MSKMYIKNGDESWIEMTKDQQDRARDLNLIWIIICAVGTAIALLLT